MTTPYIGSKISLISQLDIRYEGFLHKVDPVESTISLSRVRSFGTEDRLANVTVPARKEVYDYIIFKASDIKDLIVCDTPKPTPDIDDITYDPAIISVSKPPANVPNEERKGTQDSEASSPQSQKYGAQIESRQHQRDTSTNEKQLSGNFGQSARHQYYQQGTIQGQRQPYKYVNVRQAPPMPRVFQAQDHHVTQQQRHYGGDHRPHHPQYYYNQGRNMRKYDGDFDFEKANEDFLESVDGVIENIAELDIESDLQSPPKEIDGGTNDKAVAILEKSTKNNIYYDKSRSFFDNISCEATEREAGKDNRIDWKKERMTNEVTFGPAAVRMHNFHRRNSRGGAAPHLRRVGYFNNQQPRRYEAGPPENIRSGVFDRQNK